METIIFFTNRLSIHDMEGSGFHNVSSSWPLDEKNIFFEVEVDESRRFLIAYDGVTTDAQFSKIAEHIQPENVYVIYHSKPETPISLLQTKLDGYNFYPFPSRHHSSTLYNHLPDIEKNQVGNNKEKLAVIFQLILDSFTNISVQEKYVRQWKALSLISINIRNRTITSNEQLQTELRKIGGLSSLNTFKSLADFEKDKALFWDASLFQ